jgi:putative tricarboxylic transport membrane protein
MDAPPSAARKVVYSELALALGVVALGLFIILEARGIKVSPAYSRIGPRVFPTIVGGFTALIGLALVPWALRGGWITGHEEPGPAQVDRRGIALVSAGLLVQILLLEHAGFVISSTLLFVLVAAGFHSRHHLRDLAIGLVLAVAAYEGFTRGLGLSLPPGVLRGVL